MDDLVKICGTCKNEYTSKVCKVCKARHAATYYQKNRELILAKPRDNFQQEKTELTKAKAKEWRTANAERIKQVRKEFAATNPEKFKVRRQAERAKLLADPVTAERKRKSTREYMARNYEKNRPKKQAYNIANSSKIVAAVKAWRQKNPDAVARHANNRRARKVSAGGVISRGLVQRLLILQKGQCACCGEPLGSDYQLDHILPLALGGSNSDENIQLLKSACNAKKGAKHPIDFMQQKGFLL